MDDILNTLKTKLKNSMKVLHEKLSNINASGAHPSLLNGIDVECYGTHSPIGQVANIKVKDAQTLIITPFDKQVTKDILSAIHKSNLGLSPVDEGASIRIFVPPLTSDKREIFVKEAKEVGEEVRIMVRNIRQDSIKKLRNQKDFSKNEIELAEEKIQKEIDSTNKEIEILIKQKVENLKKI